MSTEPAGEHRLLGVFAHPDDETIAAGTLLAAAVVAGVDVSVVTCTRGERGEVIVPTLAHLAEDPPALGAHREEELSAALAELGVARHLYLDQVPGLEGHRPATFVDSGMTWVSPGIAGPVPDAGHDAFSLVDLETAARLLAVVIRHVRPTALLTEEPTGGYGHPDHVQTHRVTMRAAEIAADDAAGVSWTPPADGVGDPLDGLEPWRVPAVLWVAQAEPDTRAATEQLRLLLEEALDEDGALPPRYIGADGRPFEVPSFDDDLPGLIVGSDEIAAVVVTSHVTDRVLEALRAHRTQVQGVAAVTGDRPLTDDIPATGDDPATRDDPATGDDPVLDDTPLAGHFALSNNSIAPLLDRAYIRLAPGSEADDLVRVLTSPGAPSVPHEAGHDDGAAHPPAVAAAHTADLAGAGAHEPHRGAFADHGGAHTTTTVAGAATRTPDDDRTGSGVTGLVLCAVLGVIMGLLGTVMHRYELGGWPLGMALALAGVLAGAVLARTVARSGGLLVTGLGVVFATQAMTFMRPGGDVIVTGEAIGYIWLFGAPAMCFVAGFLPRRWFSDKAARSGRTGGER